MDIISLIVAIISFVASVVSFIVTFLQNRKINSLNLQSRYFEKIFDEYLIDKIPKARNYIRYHNNKLADADKLIDRLGELKKSSLYFKYSNSEFYDKLKESIDDLEQFLTDCSNISETDLDKQSQNILKIGEKVSSLYKLINKYSTGVK